jgi:hypothetical protein
MAAWSSIIWHESVQWIENGSSGCETPRNPLYIRCSAGKSLKTTYMNSTLHIRPRRISLIHFKNVNREDISIKQTLRGVRFNIRGETVWKLRRIEEKSQQTNKRRIKSFEQDYWTSGPLTFSTKNMYAKLGW